AVEVRVENGSLHRSSSFKEIPFTKTMGCTVNNITQSFNLICGEDNCDKTQTVEKLGEMCDGSFPSPPPSIIQVAFSNVET
ncbi:hypothetical protein PMAYCL1PPCAC_19319, partial [Pristionchus mayeri]